MHTSSSAIAESRRPHAGKLSQASLLHQSDERLVALARSGSERAWAEITRRYGRQLRVYCARFVGASRAEDAVQQTFLQAFLALRDASPREILLRAWLYRIAHNCAVDVLRKGTADYDELDLEYDGVAQPPTLFEQREEIRRIVARMRDLPKAQREALTLRELEGRSYEEISAQLGHSGSGVRQLIFRARTALRNSAAGILPLGFLKARLSQPVPLECHHVATAVSVPASSGGGIDVVGAATLAVVAVLGGGLAAPDGASKKAPPRVVRATAAGPAPAATGVSAAAAAPVRPSAAPPRGRADRGGARTPAGDAPAAAPVASAPMVAPPAVAPPVAPAAVGPASPAVDAQTPATGDVAQSFASNGPAEAGTATGSSGVQVPAAGAGSPRDVPAGEGNTAGSPGGPSTNTPVRTGKPAKVAPVKQPGTVPAKAAPPRTVPVKSVPVKAGPAKTAPVKAPVKTVVPAVPVKTAPQRSPQVQKPAKTAPSRGRVTVRSGERG